MALRYREDILRHDLRNLTTRQRLYTILKQELKALGWWKNRKRGRHAGRKSTCQGAGPVE
jgi:hypothetical protein